MQLLSRTRGIRGAGFKQGLFISNQIGYDNPWHMENALKEDIPSLGNAWYKRNVSEELRRFRPFGARRRA